MDQGESKLIWKRKDGREGKTTDDGRAEKAKRAVRKKWDGGGRESRVDSLGY